MKSKSLANRLMKSRLAIASQEHLWLLYYLYAVNRKRRRGQAIGWHETHASKSATILIDGFPGSGNSYLTKVIKKTQGSEFKLAHHLHAPSQAIRSLKLGVPTILVVRDPIDAACSMHRRFGYPLEWALQANVRFHEALVPFSEDFFVAPFEAITSDPRSVLEQVNQYFESELLEVDYDEKVVDGLWAIGEGLKNMDPEKVALARQRKNELKASAEDLCAGDLKEQLYFLYHQFVKPSPISSPPES